MTGIAGQSLIAIKLQNNVNFENDCRGGYHPPALPGIINDSELTYMIDDPGFGRMISAPAMARSFIPRLILFRKRLP